MRRIPCRHTRSEANCVHCERFDDPDSGYAGIWTRSETSTQMVLPCLHLGEATGEVNQCLPCEEKTGIKGKTRLKVFTCSHPAHGTTTIPACRTCVDYAPRLPVSTFTPHANDFRCGVIFGVYTAWSALIELQVRLVRHHCGPVPILIADDCSPSGADLQRIATDYEGVSYWPNATRIGHAGGDLSAIWKGMHWAKRLGLSAVAKLSQRYLVDVTRWLQDGSASLLTSGLPLASQRCVGGENFPLRTEAMLLDVAAWSQPGPMADLFPRTLGSNAESWLADVLRSRLGGRFQPWSLLGSEDRYRRTPGVLWHCANGVGEYHELAHRHGLELPHGFHTDGWQHSIPHGGYLVG